MSDERWSGMKIVSYTTVIDILATSVQNTRKLSL